MVGILYAERRAKSFRRKIKLLVLSVLIGVCCFEIFHLHLVAQKFLVQIILESLITPRTI